MAQSAVHLPLKKVAPGTYLIQEVQHALGQPLSVHINSAVILGSEPGSSSADRCGTVRLVAGAQPPPCPDQSVLEALLGAGEAT